MSELGHDTNEYLKVVLWEIYLKYALGLNPLIKLSGVVWKDYPPPPAVPIHHTWSGTIVSCTTTDWDNLISELENAESTALSRWISDYLKDPVAVKEPDPEKMGKVYFKLYKPKTKKPENKNADANGLLPWHPGYIWP